MNFNIRMGIPEMQELWLDLQEKYRSGNIKKKEEQLYKKWGKATVNFVFDRYMSLKNNLKPTTKSNYLYMYDRFIFTDGRLLRFFLEPGAESAKFQGFDGKTSIMRSELSASIII